MTARARVAELEQEQRSQEAEARDQEALLAKLEAQQHQVKNNREYTALLQEMEVARESISSAETAVLEAMEELEAARLQLAESESSVASQLEEIAAEERGIQARGEALEGSIAELQTRRGALGEHVPPEVMARYQKILARRSPAVAIVSGEICTGCRVGIPPQNYIEILQGDSLVVCGQCKRILIHGDHLGDPEAADQGS